MIRSSIQLQDINPNIDLERDILGEISKKAEDIENAFRWPEYLLISVDLYMLLICELHKKGLLDNNKFDVDIIKIGEFDRVVKVILLDVSIIDFFDISYSLKYGCRRIDMLDKHPKTKREEIPDSEQDDEEFLKNLDGKR